MHGEEKPLDGISGSLPPGAAKVLSAVAGGVTPGIKDTSADIWGALVGDRVKFWRVRNWINGLEKTAAHLYRMGLDPSKAKHLPYGDMLVLFDGMSKEEDADLSDMWARLLADAMRESGEPSVSTRSVASVLEQMSPESARVFLLLAKLHRLEFLDRKIGGVQNEELFALSGSEKGLDEKSLIVDRDRVGSEVEESWSNIRGGAQLDISKSELLRLNLIQAKMVPISFDDRPFSRGFSVNAAGIDTVLSEMIHNIKDFVDNRTLPFAKSLVEDEASRRVNFELSVSGIEVAKKLSIF